MNQPSQLVCPSCHERLRFRDPMLFREPGVLCPGCGVALDLSRSEDGAVNVKVVARQVSTPSTANASAAASSSVTAPHTIPASTKAAVSPANKAGAQPGTAGAVASASKTSLTSKPSSKTGPSRGLAAPRTGTAVSRWTRQFRWLTQYPALTAIAATGVLVTGLIVAVVVWGPQSTGSAPVASLEGKPPRVDDAESAHAAGAVGSVGTVATESATAIDDKRAAAARDPIEDRLQNIGNPLVADTDRMIDQLPAAVIGPDQLPVDESLSWLAALADDLSPQRVGAPQRDLGWRDPANEGFVRRRIEVLLNPNILQLASEDRYPATHFVGITGYGPDAANLSASDPRAGAFRNRGGTRWADFRDGRSNSMLVAGVSKNIGPWAAGGTASARAFTKSPFVNGPDGFGVGQDGNVPVLMADGSVRHLAANVDDAVVRSLVCIANDDVPMGETGAEAGSALPAARSSAKPGEPIADDASKSPSQLQNAAANQAFSTVDGKTDPKGADSKTGPTMAADSAEKQAVAPSADPATEKGVAGKVAGEPDAASEDDKAEDDADASEKTGDENDDIADATTDAADDDEPMVVAIDIPAAMAVKLVKFEENGNATLDTALLQFSDLVGVPVQLTPDAELAIIEQRQKPVRISLKNVTVGEALTKVLEPFGLVHEIGEQRVQIVPRPAADKK